MQDDQEEFPLQCPHFKWHSIYHIPSHELSYSRILNNYKITTIYTISRHRNYPIATFVTTIYLRLFIGTIFHHKDYPIAAFLTTLTLRDYKIHVTYILKHSSQLHLCCGFVTLRLDVYVRTKLGLLSSSPLPPRVFALSHTQDQKRSSCEAFRPGRPNMGRRLLKCCAEVGNNLHDAWIRDKDVICHPTVASNDVATLGNDELFTFDVDHK